MSSQIVINVNPQETRVALIENDTVSELYIERHSERSILGNIYKGRVLKVLPGMQAAFIDIGLEKAAFLYVTDVRFQVEEFESMMGEIEKYKVNGEEDESFKAPLPFNTVPSIEDLICEGQELIVQVAKEPIGTKGARITSHISLPGRYLVLLPTVNHVGVSRRIENEKERKRLKDLIFKIRNNEYGFIARTASEGQDEETLRADMNFLLRLWEKIQNKKEVTPVPGLLYQDLDITLRAVRDLFTRNVDRLIIDSKVEYERIMDFIQTFMPSLKSQVELYDEDEPIFDYFGIEVEISRALGRKVWLKSGGYILIDVTEALTAIDVNSGKYVGKRNLEETILKINLEAVKEIAYQLRLRNIGGIIIIDFIDMEKESNREKVFNALKEALKKDRSKTNILKISELGLIQMTRQRSRESIVRTLCEPCFYCDGKGFIKSKRTICYEIFREIIREAAHNKSNGEIIVRANPEIAGMLLEEERPSLEKLEADLKISIIVEPRDKFHQEQYECIFRSRQTF
jgi:ribonuclease G